MSKPRIALLVFLGLACGYIFFLLELHGAFVRWEKLPVAPVDSFSLQSMDTFQLAIEKDGVIYHWDGDAWQAGDISIDSASSEFEEEVGPCNSSEIPFWPTSGGPDRIQDCLEATWVYIEWSDTLIYAVDGDGSVWRWYLSNHIWDDILTFITSIFLGGILLPLGAGMVIGVKHMIREFKQP